MVIALLFSLLLTQATTPQKPTPAPQQPTPPKTAPAPAQPRPQTTAPRRAAPAAVSGIAITATDGRGTPFENVSVELSGSMSRTGNTDGAGQVSFPSLPPGTYRLRFTGDNIATFEREVTTASGQIVKLPITLTRAEPPRVVAPPPAAPAPPPRPAAGPAGQPQVVSVVDLVEKELISGRQPRKDTLVSCSGNTRTMLVQLNEPQAQRVYDDAEVLYYVIAGEGSITVTGRDVPLKAGAYAGLPRGTLHSVSRSGRRPLILLAVLSGEPCESAK